MRSLTSGESFVFGIRASRRLLAAAVLAVATLAACEQDSTAPVTTYNDHGFVVRSSAGVLRLTNNTAAPVFTKVMGGSEVEGAEWTPCVDATACPPIGPGASRSLQFPGGSGEDYEYVAVVYWWYAESGEGGAMQADSLRAITIGR